MDFADLLPELRPWVQSLSSVWPGPLIKSSSWAFPVIQTFHLLALATLGGCILLPGLRLMGAGMTQQSPAEIERAVRPWLWGALIVLAVTGVLMSLVIAPRLYARPAFLVKTIALVAALILSLGVVRSIASHNGVLTRTAKALTAAALALWLTAVAIFGTSFGAAPGTVHLVTVGWLVVMAFSSRATRLALGAISLVAAIGLGVVTYVIFHPMDHYDLVMEINRWAVRAAGLVVAGFAVWEFARVRERNVPSTATARLIGFFSIIAWFTVAAAGRWIGLSGGG